MTTVSSAVTEGAKTTTPPQKHNGRNGKLRVMCRYGGTITTSPPPRYVGGDTRIVALPPSAQTNFSSLVTHLTVTLGIGYAIKVKYQLPDHDLDSLISVETDEDVQIMMEEHGYEYRIRLFLFPLKWKLSEGDSAQCNVDWLGIGESKVTQTDTWFVDALKSAESGRNDSGSSGDGNGMVCGQESMMLEMNSSFGSTSSSVSSSNLPTMKSEDNMANSQVKYAPIESTASDNTAVVPVSSHELPTYPRVLESEVYSNNYKAERNKPVPILVSGYPPFVNQGQQQHYQVIYTGQPYVTGNSPVTFPATTYHHHPNQIHYQLPPQPYPIYYIPVEQYSSRHVQAPLVQPNTVLTTQQVDSPVVRTSSPLASGLSSQVYHPPKPVDSTGQTSSEATLSSTCRDDLIYNDLDDDMARAQIYKSQPPAPIVPSDYQIMNP